MKVIKDRSLGFVEPANLNITLSLQLKARSREADNG
jgi:hypothetical protein